MPAAHYYIFILISIGPLIILDTAARLLKLPEEGSLAANAPRSNFAIENTSMLKGTNSDFRDSSLMMVDSGPNAPHDATLRNPPNYWHPYATPSKNRFAEEAEEVRARSRGQQSEKEPVRTRRESAIKWLKKKLSKSPKGTPKEENLPEAAGSTDGTTSSPMVKLFDHLFHNEKSIGARSKLAQEAVAYLTRTPGLEEKELSEWVTKIIQIATEPKHRHGLEYLSTLFYGLHSLVLKNYNNEVLRSSMIAEINEGIIRIRENWKNLIMTKWDQEMFIPSNGLSKTLGDWNELNEIILHENSLKNIRIGLSNNRLDVIKHLEDIKTIFSMSYMHYYSAETRVAAIGALFQIMKRETNQSGYDNAAVKLAKAMINHKEKKDMFLFDHERTLLEVVMQKIARDTKGQNS